MTGLAANTVHCVVIPAPEGHLIRCQDDFAGTRIWQYHGVVTAETLRAFRAYHLMWGANWRRN